MKGVVFVIIALLLSAGLYAQVFTCRQIQETTDPSGNSPHMDQIRQVRGIVTAIKRGSSFYIGDPLEPGDDGRWSGLYVFDTPLSNTVNLGDMIRITGSVKEINGQTQLRLITSSQVESPGNTIPVSTVTTAQVPFAGTTAEPWEGVMIRLNNVKVTTPSNIFNQFQIADASVPGVAEARVDDFLYAYPASSVVVGDVWHQIQGVLDYASDGFRILPRLSADMIKDDDIFASKISIQSRKGQVGQTTAVEVKTTKLIPAWNVTSYTMTFQIDATLVRFMGVDYGGTLTASSPTVTDGGNTITISYTSANVMEAPVGDNVLIKLLLQPRSYGNVPITINSFLYNNYAITNFENGSLSVVLEEFKAHLNIYTEDTSTGRVSDKNIFNPTQELIKIEYGTKGGFLARTIIRIYDAQGRIVATPLNENFIGSTSSQQIGKISWNGRDTSMNLLPPGLYYCHMEVADRQTGDIARTVQPIVIKSRLK